MENIRQTREVCDRYGIPLFIDACRFAENAWFIKQREPGQERRGSREIAHEMFRLADLLSEADRAAVNNANAQMTLENLVNCWLQITRPGGR